MKTSNTNFRVTSQEKCNNDNIIYYTWPCDSIIFTKSIIHNNKIDNINLIENYNFDSKLLTKKCRNDINNEKTDCWTNTDDNDTQAFWKTNSVVDELVTILWN